MGDVDGRHLRARRRHDRHRRHHLRRRRPARRPRGHRGLRHGHPRRALRPGPRPAEELGHHQGGHHRHPARSPTTAASTRSRCSRWPASSPTPSTPCSRTARSRRSSAATTRPDGGCQPVADRVPLDCVAPWMRFLWSRTSGGSRAVRRRAGSALAGKVPGVLYGHGIDPIDVAVGSRELRAALTSDSGLNALISLDVDGTQPPGHGPPAPAPPRPAHRSTTSTS